ncbi:MAG: ABC transporter ATP-binding protein [Deltaproteobacteria bacterium]|nr:ABC transporter ATP-binding protein [Deltaproteobacteria bacterium]
MLRLNGVQKSFDGFMAVSQADLHVAPGETVAVIGPNGAGKSTLFNLITGQLRPDKGRIVFQGQDITGLAPHRICQRGLGRSFQIVNLFQRMTVFENVQVSVLAHHKRTFNLFRPAASLVREATDAILHDFGLLEQADRVSGSLSHGDQKVLEMAISLGGEPQMLILDEPTAGMSAEETAVLIRLVNQLCREKGLTILFCEHDMEVVFSISDRIMVMQQGVSLIQDVPEVVRADKRVQEAYLGGAA